VTDAAPDREEAARFSSYAEAQVACSALQAAGIAAVMVDQDPVAGAWREPYGAGGYRIFAPADQVVDARLLLRRADASSPRKPSASPALKTDRLVLIRLLLIAGLFLAIAAAFLIRGF
jgi:hypothetical protein